MTSTKKIVNNAGWIIGCRIVQSVLMLVIGMISARYLGPANYGLISYAGSVVAFAVPIARLGLKDTLVEELVSNPEREGKTLGTAIGISALSSLLCMVGIAAFSLIANAGSKETTVVCVLYSISLIFQMTEMIQYWYQAKLLSKYTSIVSLAVYCVVSAYKIFLLITGKSIYWFSITQAMDFMLISVALYVIYRKLGTQKFGFSKSLAKQMLSKSKHYIIPGMMVVVFAQTDKILLKNLINDEATGFYTAALTCTGMTSFVYQAVIDSFRPMIFECRKTDYESFEKNVARLYSIILYMGVAQSVVFTFFAKWIVLIVYGADYQEAIIILQVLTWSVPFSYIGYVRNIWMLAEEKQKYLWSINLSGVVVNVLMNLALIPFVGTVGAAITSVVTQFATNMLLCFIVKPIRPTGKLIVKSLNPKILLELLPKRSKKS